MTWRHCEEDGCHYACPATLFDAGIRTHTRRIHSRKATPGELGLPQPVAADRVVPEPQIVRHHYPTTLRHGTSLRDSL